MGLGPVVGAVVGGPVVGAVVVEYHQNSSRERWSALSSKYVSAPLVTSPNDAVTTPSALDSRKKKNIFVLFFNRCGPE